MEFVTSRSISMEHTTTLVTMSNAVSIAATSCNVSSSATPGSNGDVNYLLDNRKPIVNPANQLSTETKSSPCNYTSTSEISFSTRYKSPSDTGKSIFFPFFLSLFYIHLINYYQFYSVDYTDIRT